MAIEDISVDSTSATGQKPTHPSSIKVVPSPTLIQNSSSTTKTADGGQDLEKSYILTATATKPIAPNTLIAKNTTSTTIADKVSYASVQISRDQHILLNSDLVYCNHSCDPNVRFVVVKDDTPPPGAASNSTSKNGEANIDIQLWSLENAIKEGEELRFFYPSTEWDMAQPFPCSCGATSASNTGGPCLGEIKGAKDIETEVLNRYWLSDHIRGLIEERDATKV
ncbi:hypothetical protein FQN54_007395 [Arachnomyces sp. PD_36]|nr:hypothetical protein FQN54_007395 [Arachnomyces sp. PD_36]